MSLNDNAVFTAAKGYVFTAPVGTAAPTPAEIAEFEPETFGGANHELKVTGKPTGGTFTITYDTATTDAIPYNATSGAVQAALEKLANVGAGNVVVTGETLAEGLTIAFIGDLRTSDKAPTATADFTGGSTPKVTVAKGAEGNAWDPIGHTAEEDLPEFGYEGGDKESKGTWQKKNLKEVTTEAVVDYVTMKLNQFDLKTFSYYYGKNKSSSVLNLVITLRLRKLSLLSSLMVITGLALPLLSPLFDAMNLFLSLPTISRSCLFAPRS